MNIVIRVDSSQWIGVGHLSRCLTLAQKLKEKHQVLFITEEGIAEQLIQAQGFHYYTLPKKIVSDPILNVEHYLSQIQKEMTEDALLSINILKMIGQIDWLIVDHYAINEVWHKQMRPYVRKIMVIDDLANRKYDCDLLLDQNYYKDYLSRYTALVPHHCKLLLGPNYMLLRDEFIGGAAEQKRIRTELKHLLVFYGGSDPTNETLKVLQAIEKLQLKDVHIDIVTGKLNKQKEQIKVLCEHYDYITYHEQIDYMAELMLKADLALGAGGSTTWERCKLGLPAVVTILAENQKVGIQDIEGLGFLDNLGEHQEVTAELIAEKIIEYKQGSKLEEMSQTAYSFFNEGATFTNQVCQAISE